MGETGTNISSSQQRKLHVDPAMAAAGFWDVSEVTRLKAILNMAADLSVASSPRAVIDLFITAEVEVFGRYALINLSTHELPEGDYRITRFIDEQGKNHVAVSDPWSNRDKLAVFRGGLMGQIIADGQPKIAGDLQMTDDPVLGDALRAYHSLAAVPSFMEREPTYWAITLSTQPQGYDLKALEELLLRVNLVGTSVKHLRTMQQLDAAHREIRSQVEHIAHIQRALLPGQIPTIPGLSVAASYETFDQAGGDMYDVAQVGPTTWMFLIADVSGHGPGAAVMMAMLSSILSAYPVVPQRPSELLQFANKHLCLRAIEGQFITAFLAFYNTDTHELTYARAGHNPPVIRGASGSGVDKLMTLDAAGELPLGIIEDVRYTDATVRLEKGQTMVLYTDGITEAINPSGDMFGVAGVEASLRLCSGEPQCALDHIRAALHRHQANRRPNDDQTLVVAQVVA